MEFEKKAPMTTLQERLRLSGEWFNATGLDGRREIGNLAIEAASALDDKEAEIAKWRDAVVTLMEQPTMSPLKMTPEQRKALWEAFDKAKALIGPPPWRRSALSPRPGA